MNNNMYNNNQGYQNQQMGYGQSQVPMGGQQVPMGQTQVPMGYNQGPMGQTQVPMGYNQVPMGGQQPQAPMGMQGQPMGYGQPMGMYPVSNPGSDGFGIVAVILGIVSIVGSIFTIFELPIPIIGLICSFKAKASKTLGIVLNCIGIFLCIVAFFLYAFMGDQILNIINKIESNPVEGNYNCKGVDSSTDEYLITLNLNHDNTFLYGPYGKMENNYAKGTYEYEDLEKTNASGDYNYYSIKFTGPKEDFVVNGVPSTTDFKGDAEFGITYKDGKKEGVILFVNSYNMYYCYEQ